MSCPHQHLNMLVLELREVFLFLSNFLKFNKKLIKQRLFIHLTL